MSTTAEQLPDAADVPASSITPWRIANGKFRRGRGDGEEHPVGRMVGFVKRFAIEEGTGDDGKVWKQLEVDLDTKEGFERVKVNYNTDQNMWPTQGIGLAKVLATIDGSFPVVIEPSLSREVNKHGKHTTFVNVDKFNMATGRRETIQTDWDGQKFRDIADEVFEVFAKNPLYKNRERETPESEKGEFNWFLEMIEAKGWPDWQGNEAAYVEALNTELLKAGNGAIAPEDMDEDYFNFARQAWDEAKDCPLHASKPAPKPKLSKPAPAPEEKDPFANE